MHRNVGSTEQEIIAASRWGIQSILKQQALQALYQPIISIRDLSIYGYEALIRGPDGSHLHSPIALIDAAESAGCLTDFDLACRHTILQRASRLSLPGRLFINMVPSHLLDPGFPHRRIIQELGEAGVAPTSLVLELTEQFPINDYDQVRRTLAVYRDAGISIALDDLGSGYAGLQLWSELKPDYVKIDSHFVRNVHLDAAKRQFIHSICEIAHILDCRVIAEGIESIEEFDTLRGFDIHYAQGFLIARPSAVPLRQLDMRDELQSAAVRFPSKPFSPVVASLVREHPWFDPRMSLDDVVDFMQENPEYRCVPVVAGTTPVGLVGRVELLTLYASRFSRELYGRKPVATFMRRDPVIVHQNTPVESLSQKITNCNLRWADDDFIVVDEGGNYIGVGMIVDLLRSITEMQIRNARYANPLTQLPGNVPVSEHIDTLLAQGHHFVLAYVDIDNFKPFNDVYGYARGDDAIRAVARLLAQYSNPAIDMVGHIGGDDFIVIFRSKDWLRRCQCILDAFSEHAPRLYDTDARSAGGIETCGRDGSCRFFKFLSISIGATPSIPGLHHNHNDISQLAAEVKRQAKLIDGNSLFVDRRTV